MKYIKLFEQFILNEKMVPTKLKAKKLTISDELDMDSMIEDMMLILQNEHETELVDAQEELESGESSDAATKNAMMQMVYVQLLKSLENEYDVLLSQAVSKNVKGGDFYLSWSADDLKNDIKDNVKDIIKDKKSAIYDALSDIEYFDVPESSNDDIEELEDELEAAKEYRKSLDIEMDAAVKPGMFDDSESYDKFADEYGQKMNDADDEIKRLEDELKDLKSEQGEGIDLDKVEKDLNAVYSKSTKAFELFIKKHLLTI